MSEVIFKVLDGALDPMGNREGCQAPPATQAEGLFRYIIIIDGRTKVGDPPRVESDYIMNPVFEVVTSPGRQLSFYVGNNFGDTPMPQLARNSTKSAPAARNPAARIEFVGL